MCVNDLIITKLTGQIFLSNVSSSPSTPHSWVLNPGPHTYMLYQLSAIYLHPQLVKLFFKFGIESVNRAQKE
jgi:hypothetical protein